MAKKEYKQAVHAVCPEAPDGGTHHLVPISGVMACRYCKRSQRGIEAELNN